MKETLQQQNFKIIDSIQGKMWLDHINLSKSEKLAIPHTIRLAYLKCFKDWMKKHYYSDQQTNNSGTSIGGANIRTLSEDSMKGEEEVQVSSKGGF